MPIRLALSLELFPPSLIQMSLIQSLLHSFWFSPSGNVAPRRVIMKSKSDAVLDMIEVLLITWSSATAPYSFARRRPIRGHIDVRDPTCVACS